MGIALSGSTPVWGEFPGATRNQYILGLTTFLIKAGWTLDQKVKASVTGTYVGNRGDGDTVQVGGLTYTWKTVINNTVPRQALIGTDLEDSLTHMVEAVNAGMGVGTDYSTVTIPHPTVKASSTATTLTFTFFTGGPQGNGTPSTFGPLINGGYKIVGTSPQLQTGTTDPLKTNAYIYDRQLADFTGQYTSTKLFSGDLMVESAEKLTKVAAMQRFRVVANRCQFFCYRPGVAAGNLGTVVAGGVPWVPPVDTGCSGDSLSVPTSDLFWATSDRDNIGDPFSTPRTTVVGSSHYTVDEDTQVTSQIINSSGWGATDASFDNLLVSNTEPGHFRVMSPTPSQNYIVNGAPLVDASRWLGNGRKGRRMLVEPLVAWAPIDATHGPLVRGQLWDAWIGTEQQPMDTVQLFPEDSHYYVAFTDVCKFGTLWLWVPGPTPEQFEDTIASYAHSS